MKFVSDPYLSLSTEIIKAAADDYLKALRRLKYVTNEVEIKNLKHEIENLKKYIEEKTSFYTLGKVDGKCITEHIEKHYKDKDYRIRYSYNEE